MILKSLDNLQYDGDLRGAFQHIINARIGVASGDQNDWYPPFDIVDTKNNIYVYIELPGVTEESIGVDFFNNKLSISGEKLKRYTAPAAKNEIVYGRFIRKITLPISVTNKDNVNVNYENGILTLIINKKKEAQNRFHIDITHNNVNEIPEVKQVD
jgi:HSP20 family protein